MERTKFQTVKIALNYFVGFLCCFVVGYYWDLTPMWQRIVLLILGLINLVMASWNLFATRRGKTYASK